MPTEDEPVVTIEYWDNTWYSIAGYAKSFIVRDAGLLNVPTADITVHNKDGLFTSGTTKIPGVAPIRISADVRGAVDEIFRGYYVRYDGDKTRRKHDLKLHCVGYGVKLLWDTITYPYHQDNENRGVWTMKDVIEDFLGAPDSGVGTGITLVTDGGAILTEEPTDDFERETLLDALRKIGERLNYDGYMTDAPPNLELVFKEVGTVQTNPPITLQDPFVHIRPIQDWEEIRNHILPWGDIEIGHPPGQDRWTEDHDRWAGLWVGDANNTVSTSAAAMVGVGSIKVENLAGSNMGATLDISVDPDYSYINCSTGRFNQLALWIYSGFLNNFLQITTDLTDTLGNVIRRGPGLLEFKYPALKKEAWQKWWQDIGPTLDIESSGYDGWVKKHWWYMTGSDFNWKVQKVRLWAKVGVPETGFLHLDGLHFRGGARIDPLVNTGYYPTCPVKSDMSIGLYKRRVKHVENREIRTFVQATLMGQRELATLKDPIRKIKVKKGAKTWARPHETILLNLPDYEINSEEWRILELRHEWKAKGNHLRTEFTLVPQSVRMSTAAIQMDEPGGVLRSLR